MFIAILFYASVLSTSTDTLLIFEDDFSVPGQFYWADMFNYWDYFNDDCMREFFYLSGPGQGYTVFDTLYSPVVPVPLGTENLIIEVPMTYDVSITLHPSGGQGTVRMRLLTVLESGQKCEVWDVLHGTTGGDSWQDTLSVIVDLPSECWNPGENLQLLFAGRAFADNDNYTYPVYVGIDWQLDSVSLFAVGETTVLQRSTWGGIKATF